MTEPDKPDGKLVQELAAYMTRERAQEIVQETLTPRKGRGAGWVKALKTAAEQLGGGWIVVGSGIRARLLHTPVSWWVDMIGNDGNPSGGWLTLTHQALTTPLSPTTYTNRQDAFRTRQRAEFPTMPQGWPDVFDTDTAAALVRWFAEGPLTDAMTKHSDRETTDLAERLYANHFNARPRRWPMLAGWRVIFDTGSPLPVIDDMLTLIDQGFYKDEKPFWEAFLALAHDADRSAMLAFLDTERRRGLREHYNLADEQIADVLTDR